MKWTRVAIRVGGRPRDEEDHPSTYDLEGSGLAGALTDGILWTRSGGWGPCRPLWTRLGPRSAACSPSRTSFQAQPSTESKNLAARQNLTKTLNILLGKRDHPNYGLLCNRVDPWNGSPGADSVVRVDEGRAAAGRVSQSQA
jgi:hypothetical protein